jgi:hypothetical protein
MLVQLILAPSLASLSIILFYFGNVTSKIFHKPSCCFSPQVGHKAFIHLAKRHQAIEAGYSPCKHCLPPFELKVSGRIVDLDKEQNAPLRPSD